MRRLLDGEGKHEASTAPAAIAVNPLKPPVLVSVLGRSNTRGSRRRNLGSGRPGFSTGSRVCLAMPSLKCHRQPLHERFRCPPSPPPTAPRSSTRTGAGSADRVQPRLAAVGRRLGQPDAVLPAAGLPRDRPRPARSRPLHPDRRAATTWTTTPTTSPRSSSTSTCTTPSTSGIPPAAARWSRYLARHGESRAAKAALISAVPPLMVQTDANPEGLPKSVFDDLQAQLAANRSVFYRALPVGAVLRIRPARCRVDTRPSSRTGGARA